MFIIEGNNASIIYGVNVVDVSMCSVVSMCLVYIH